MAKVQIEQKKVIGITHGKRKNTGLDYTIIFYTVPVNPIYGKGLEGKYCYLSGNVTNIEIGDSIFLNFTTSSSGNNYVQSVTVLNKKS